MKEWTIYYKNAAPLNRTRSSGFEAREQALEFMKKVVSQGGGIRDIKQKGRSVLATDVFCLLRDAKLRVGLRLDNVQQPTTIGPNG